MMDSGDVTAHKSVTVNMIVFAINRMDRANVQKVMKGFDANRNAQTINMD